MLSVGVMNRYRTWTFKDLAKIGGVN